MSLIVNTRQRSNAVEIMDDFSLEGEQLRDTLDKLATINKWLGGNRVTINGLKQLIKCQPKDKLITIIDLGCGGGDILRNIARVSKKEDLKVSLIGVDANLDAIEYARLLSKDYKNIEFIHSDVFSETFNSISYDVVLSTLFFHHFKDKKLQELLEDILKKAEIGIVVNDLHRHPLAYYLFKIVCLPIKNKMIIEDGLTSILRGFKREELVKISKKLNADYAIKWKWAFRYQWILKKR